MHRASERTLAARTFDTTNRRSSASSAEPSIARSYGTPSSSTSHASLEAPGKSARSAGHGARASSLMATRRSSSEIPAPSRAWSWPAFRPRRIRSRARLHPSGPISQFYSARPRITQPLSKIGRSRYQRKEGSGNPPAPSLRRTHARFVRRCAKIRGKIRQKVRQDPHRSGGGSSSRHLSGERRVHRLFTQISRGALQQFADSRHASSVLLQVFSGGGTHSSIGTPSAPLDV